MSLVLISCLPPPLEGRGVKIMTGREVINQRENINTKYKLMIIDIIPDVGGPGRRTSIIRSTFTDTDTRPPIRSDATTTWLARPQSVLTT